MGKVILWGKKYNYGKYFKCICSNDNNNNFGLKKIIIHQYIIISRISQKNIFFLVKFSNKILFLKTIKNCSYENCF